MVAEYVWMVVSIRCLIGLAMGAISPALQAAISNWAPPDELGKFQSVYMAGGIGLVIDWCMSGFIIKHLGWTYSFYITSALLGLFAIVWFLIMYDSPSDHPKISTAEKDYILSRLNATPTKSKPWPPFKSILLSVPVWALVFFHFGNIYPMYVFITSVPKYFSDVHQLNIATVGILSSIPQLLRFPFSLLFGAFGDYVLKKEMMSILMARKLFSIITHFLPSVFLIALPFFADQPFVCVALMTISLGFSSAISITSIGNTYDLSPNFATTIFSWMQSIGLTTGFIVPLVVTHFTKERSSNEEWGYVFVVSAIVSVIGAIIFIMFGSGEVQNWNSAEVVNETLKEVKAVPKNDIFRKLES
ncbi:hypothetical protein HA402_010884 [Bradysia odoriphaga]|nr:hypothetical protein HA402_010884 [Bradysia odoriphaga]